MTKRKMSPTTAAAILVKWRLDEAPCKVLLTRLKEYDLCGVGTDRPFHDDASHGADAFPTFGFSNEDARMAQTTQVDRHARLFSKTTVAGASMTHLLFEHC